ncbi:MAG: thioredoxin family protein [Pseudomonadota bacterium]
MSHVTGGRMARRQGRRGLLAAAVMLALAPAARAADPMPDPMPDLGAGLTLLMLDQPYCEWCETWEAEVGVVYDLTEEGRALPLWRRDIDDPLPGVTLERRARYTPTFVLLCAGREIGRIEGYPGEDFFWGLLGRMLAGAGHAPDGTAGNGHPHDCAVQS